MTLTPCPRLPESLFIEPLSRSPFSLIADGSDRLQRLLSSYQVAPGWVEQVKEMGELLKRGDGIYQMMQVTGEEGVSLEDFVTYQKSLFLDMVYLQQDAFDKVDASAPLARQKQTFTLVYDLVNRSYQFEDKEAARDYFTRLTGVFKNLNYAQQDSPEHADYLQQIHKLADSLTQVA